eukprot:10836925-Alexandrium_andersonii.AAC.1
MDPAGAYQEHFLLLRARTVATCRIPAHRCKSSALDRTPCRSANREDSPGCGELLAAPEVKTSSLSRSLWCKAVLERDCILHGGMMGFARGDWLDITSK